MTSWPWPPAAVMPLLLAAVNLAVSGEEGTSTAVQLYIVATVLLLLDNAGAPRLAWAFASPIVVFAVGGMVFEAVAPRVMAYKARGAAQKRAHDKQVETRGVN